jgi:ubiquinone biosynthesis protein
MWAAIRLVRATRVFGMIFLSYLWALSFARLWPRRFGTPERWKKVHRKNARRMYKGFVRLRGVYIKLGQILSMMGTFLPRSYTEELEGLQDEVPAAAATRRSRGVREVAGQVAQGGVRQLRGDADRGGVARPGPRGAHRRRRAAGGQGALPQRRRHHPVDLRVLGWALKVYKNFVPINQIERVHEQLADMLARETDLANEARCMARMAKNFEGDPDVLFPTVHPAVEPQDGADDVVHGRRQDQQEGRAADAQASIRTRSRPS